MTESDDVPLLVTLIVLGAAAFASLRLVRHQRLPNSMATDKFRPALSQSCSDNPITAVRTHTLCPLTGSLAARTGRKSTQNSQRNYTSKTAADQPVPSCRTTQAQRSGHEGSDCTRDAPYSRFVGRFNHLLFSMCWNISPMSRIPRTQTMSAPPGRPTS